MEHSAHDIQPRQELMVLLLIFGTLATDRTPKCNYIHTAMALTLEYCIFSTTSSHVSGINPTLCAMNSSTRTLEFASNCTQSIATNENVTLKLAPLLV